MCLEGLQSLKVRLIVDKRTVLAQWAYRCTLAAHEQHNDVYITAGAVAMHQGVLSCKLADAASLASDSFQQPRSFMSGKSLHVCGGLISLYQMV